MEEKFKPRKALASELGIETRTFERKIKEAQIIIPKGLLSPQTQKFIKDSLVFTS
ncbi:MAG: hypothetical protein V4585_21820 [Bacteroidota bacterium]